MAALRASGPDFNVDAFIANCDWNIEHVYRRGEPRLPMSKPDGPKRAETGFNFSVSDAGFHEFAAQISDAIEFLTEAGDEVRRLVNFPGVSGVVLDFGIAWRDGAAQSDRFPADLVSLAGACGIALELSHYPITDDESAD